jgi:2-succinyl-5-enolpyruvyl-6-hydroxy-3-cyclohexene-1-carboxylate synthase
MSTMDATDRHSEPIMAWNIAQAKQRFSDLVHQAVGSHLIYNRKRLVAAVIDAEDYRAFKEWSERAGGPTLADEFAELRRILPEGDCRLAPAPRSTRPNALVETLEAEGRGLAG